MSMAPLPNFHHFSAYLEMMLGIRPFLRRLIHGRGLNVTASLFGITPTSGTTSRLSSRLGGTIHGGGAVPRFSGLPISVLTICMKKTGKVVSLMWMNEVRFGKRERLEIRMSIATRKRVGFKALSPSLRTNPTGSSNLANFHHLID